MYETSENLAGAVALSGLENKKIRDFIREKSKLLK
jgi:hypothetical protein